MIIPVIAKFLTASALAPASNGTIQLFRSRSDRNYLVNKELKTHYDKTVVEQHGSLEEIANRLMNGEDSTIEGGLRFTRGLNDGNFHMVYPSKYSARAARQDLKVAAPGALGNGWAWASPARSSADP
jgi:hypothetical protein